jgi:hypothetical protein
MKKSFLTIAILSLAALSCHKRQERSMTVIRDCSGTYLRLDGKDYQVCNIEATNDYSSGTAVKVAFRMLKECDGPAYFTCELNHPSEGWIKIVYIEEE